MLPSKEPGSLRDKAYSAIKERILRCQLAPGASITVGELARDLDLSRTPILHALDRLAADGLIHTLPRKGVVVSALGFDELIEIVEVRLLNESQAVRWAAEKAVASDVTYLEGLLDRAAEGARIGDIELSVTMDRAFHRGLSRIAGNKILEDLLKNLHERSLRFWFVSLREQAHGMRVHEEHRSILAAIAQRDPDAAEAALRQHITSFHDNVTTRALRR